MNKKTCAGVWLYRTISVASVAAVAAVIYCLSAQTASESTQLSSGLLARLGLLIGEGLFRSLAHFCEYALLSFLSVNALYSCCGYIRPVLATVFCAVYALTDEIHQIFVPGRAFQLSDITVDISGAVLGAVICTFLLVLVGRIRQKTNRQA